MSNFLKKVKNKLKREIAKAIEIKKRLELPVLPLFASNGLLASIYYTFFSTDFYREHKSVLLGRVNYQRSLSKIEETCFLLRRNIHRLEKGLIMQPRRDVFALGYIGETVECYLDAIKSEQLCSKEKKWATDVLHNYFEVVKEVPELKKVKSQFCEQANVIGGKSIPYAYSELPERKCNYSDLMVAFKRRRSVRWYQNTPVPISEIEKAVEAASLAPSACNRQPIRFYVTVDQNEATNVASIAMGTAGWSHCIPATIVVVGDLSAYPKERDRHVIYVDGSLAAMQLMLALDSLGLASCPINWPDIPSQERKMAKKLKLSKYERPIMLISVGFADVTGGIPFSEKKTVKTLVREIV